MDNFDNKLNMIGNYVKPIGIRTTSISPYKYIKAPIERNNVAQRQLRRHKMIFMLIGRATYRQMR